MGEAPGRSFGDSAPAASGAAPIADDGAGGWNLRYAVCRRLRADAEAFPRLAIDPIDTRGLDARDAALAGAIHRESVRRWLTLEALVQHGLDRPVHSVEPGVRAALLCGAAQLALLDRVPAHAAIHEAVEWAKINVRPKAGGLVNAVLRKVAGVVGERVESWDITSRRRIPRSDGGAVLLAADVLPADPLDRLGAAVSVPRGLIDKWASAFGDEAAGQMAVHTLADPPITLNIAHASAPIGDDLVGAHERDGCAVFLGTRAQLGDLLGSRTDVWVQDAAACEAVAMAAGLTPGLIVDSCAGLGTKTRQLAAVFPGAEVVASDVDDRRIAELRRLFAGHERVRVVEYGLLGSEVGARADLVLLDVPCSNTGVLPRRPEAKYRVARRQQDRLMKIQRQAMRDAMAWLAPDGRVLYSTCSVEPEENETQTAWAGKDLGLREAGVQRRMPVGSPGDPPSRYRDGAFACLLER